MGWFSRKKDKEVSNVSDVFEDSTESMNKKRQKELENMLLEFVLEAYQNKNFTVSFTWDDDRDGKEYKPNFSEFPLNKYDKYREIILPYIQKGSLVVIDKNENRSSSFYDKDTNEDYKNGGLDFYIYTKNEEGHILKYTYDNLAYQGGVKSEFELRMCVYNNEYSKYTDLEPEYSFERGWSNHKCGVDAEIKRMKKLEKLVMLMVEEQEIDLEARNLSRMDRMLGRSPIKAKRESILKELLKDD